MIRKLVAIILALAINCGVLATLNHLGTVSVASAAAPAHVQAVVTLPTTVVTPTRAQRDELHRGRGQQRPAAASSAAKPTGGGMQALVMPYYSFADQSDEQRDG